MKILNFLALICLAFIPFSSGYAIEKEEGEQKKLRRYSETTEVFPYTFISHVEKLTQGMKEIHKQHFARNFSDSVENYLIYGVDQTDLMELASDCSEFYTKYGVNDSIFPCSEYEAAKYILENKVTKLFLLKYGFKEITIDSSLLPDVKSKSFYYTNISNGEVWLVLSERELTAANNKKYVGLLSSDKSYEFKVPGGVAQANRILIINKFLER